MEANELILGVYNEFVQPIILLLFGVAFILFLWGVFNFIRGAESPEARTTGRNHIIWGIVGMAIMFSVFGILRVIAGTIGAPDPNTELELGK